VYTTKVTGTNRKLSDPLDRSARNVDPYSATVGRGFLENREPHCASAPNKTRRMISVSSGVLTLFMIILTLSMVILTLSVMVLTLFMIILTLLNLGRLSFLKPLPGRI